MEKLIMVVDDSPTIRSSVSFCLHNAGYKVAEAKDGKEALEKLSCMKEEGGQIPSLIITDVNMPRMDGIALIEKIKKGDFRFLPILVLTTESEASMIEKGKVAGASGWLVKPFQPEEFLWAIKKLVWTK
ncbi:MAG: response regulator [Deltaproteobacteria bacterium]|nr:response regulator [Deltaproteobacteria bacterium]MBW2646864.1 response regulator [Deltaproteobacteria bacterium]